MRLYRGCAAACRPIHRRGSDHEEAAGCKQANPAPPSAGSTEPAKAGSRPEFPTRNELYRKAGLLGGATLLAGGIASAEPIAKPMPPTPKPADTTASIEDGSINGKPLPKQAPKIRVYREGGGIGPSEDMWDLAEVENFIGWTMAKEGRLAIKTKYKLEYDGLKLTLDGFDPDRNIGYAYIDPHDSDRATYTPAVLFEARGLDEGAEARDHVRRGQALSGSGVAQGKVVSSSTRCRRRRPRPASSDTGRDSTREEIAMKTILVAILVATGASALADTPEPAPATATAELTQRLEAIHEQICARDGGRSEFAFTGNLSPDPPAEWGDATMASDTTVVDAGKTVVVSWIPTPP
jgi:hypothetical protein